MFVNVMKYEDSTPYEAANVLGISKWRQLKVITFPYLRKPLISVIFAVFTLVNRLWSSYYCRRKVYSLPVVLYQVIELA